MFCPWCGDSVAGGAGPPRPPFPPAGSATDAVAPAASPEPPADRGPSEASEVAVRALRERIAELTQRLDKAESDLRRELEKKQEIKRAVIVEVGQLDAQHRETKARLLRKEEEHVSAIAETTRLKDALDQERKLSATAAEARETLAEKEKAAAGLKTELDESRKTIRDLEDARDAARRQADQDRSDLAKAKGSFESEAAELRKKLAASEARTGKLKSSGDELAALKIRSEESRRRFEKERAELQAKAATLQTESEKKDQRVRELQMLVKTLGERLNDLTSRHF
ncbi:MAG TPA: hypothetical protein VKW04_25535 [Planctomycetota bacterium]|nr:hypothetical protein [Planctomycetota bacterium]